MYLWRLVKNSKAYTQHVQLPMDEIKQDDEEYLGGLEDPHSEHIPRKDRENLDELKE